MNYKLVIAAFITLTLVSGAFGQTKATSPTLGTAQLPGDKGKIGTTYQLGSKGDQLHFKLESAQVAPYFKASESLIVAGENQRILVLTYLVQNPQKAEMSLNSRSFKFTVVSPDDKNFEFGGYAYQPENLHRYQTMMKPAQKVRLVVAIPIYSKGPIHKVIVQRGSAAVLRYDLEGLVKKMNSAFSPDGFELGDQAKPEFAKPFDMSGFEVTIQSVTLRETPLGSYHAEDGGVLYAVQYKITNLQGVSQRLKWTTLKATLIDQNGEKLDWATGLVHPSGKEINEDLEAGQSMACVLLFKGTRSQKPTQLKLLDEEAKRTAVIDLP